MKYLSIFTKSGLTSDHRRRLERPSPKSSSASARRSVHGLDGLAQRGHVGDAFVLGDFQHQHAGAQAQAAHGVAQLGSSDQLDAMHQRIGADVHEQPARRVVSPHCSMAV
jgi:hypothetical protein